MLQKSWLSTFTQEACGCPNCCRQDCPRSCSWTESLSKVSPLQCVCVEFSQGFPTHALLLTWHAWWLHPGCWRGHRIPPPHNGNAPYGESRTVHRRNPWYQTWPKQTSRHLMEGPRREAVLEQTYFLCFSTLLPFCFLTSLPVLHKQRCWHCCMISACYIDLNM